MNTAQWGIVFHTNSNSPRAKRWYHVARVIEVDGQWFELYWHSSTELRGNSYAAIRNSALDAGLALLHGKFHDAPSPRNGSALIWEV